MYHLSEACTLVVAFQRVIGFQAVFQAGQFVIAPPVLLLYQVNSLWFQYITPFHDIFTFHVVKVILLLAQSSKSAASLAIVTVLDHTITSSQTLYKPLLTVQFDATVQVPTPASSAQPQLA
jgi:hypothetical protein